VGVVNTFRENFFRQIAQNFHLKKAGVCAFSINRFAATSIEALKKRGKKSLFF
jgi:hypothetical protein